MLQAEKDSIPSEFIWRRWIANFYDNFGCSRLLSSVSPMEVWHLQYFQCHSIAMPLFLLPSFFLPR